MRPDINPEISVDILNKSMHIHKVSTIFEETKYIVLVLRKYG